MGMIRAVAILTVFILAAGFFGALAGASEQPATSKLMEMGVSGGLFGENGFAPEQELLRGDAVRLLVSVYNLDTNYPDIGNTPYTDINNSIRFYRSIGLAHARNILPNETGDKFHPERPVAGMDFAVMVLRARDPNNATSITPESIPELLAVLPKIYGAGFDALLSKAPFLQADALDFLYAVHMPEVRFIREKIGNSLAASEKGENRIKVGQAIEIILSENQTTPYVWIYRVSNDKAIRLLDDYYRSGSNPKGLSGVGGRHFFYFIAEAPGDYVIEMWQNRRGKPLTPVQPMQTYRIHARN